MIDLERLARDLYQAGYRSVEAAIADGKSFPTAMGDADMVDALLLKLWTAEP
jgi:hypothetical protein